MRPLLLLALLAVAAGATGADGGNVSLPVGRRLAWGSGAGTEEDGERLPGWQGEQRRSEATPKRRRTSQGDTYAREDRERGTWMELIAWRPRAYVIHNLMSPEECVALVKTAKPFMARSTVVDSVTGESKVDPIRTR
jgi:prolyl 4-hydroxylase